MEAIVPVPAAISQLHQMEAVVPVPAATSQLHQMEAVVPIQAAILLVVILKEMKTMQRRG
jgi:hypothetical protein